MNPIAEIHELWCRREYMNALTRAWTIGPSWKYVHIRSLHAALDLRNLIFNACHTAVANIGGRAGDRSKAKSWVEELLANEVPKSLIDHDAVELNESWCQQHRKQMILAHLLCAHAAVDSLSASEATGHNSLQAINAELQRRSARPLPLAFLDDLSNQLLIGRPSKRRADEIWFPLVGDGELQSAFIAKFVLEAIPGETGEVYITPEQAFVPIDDSFRRAFDDAPQALKLLNCSPTSNVRVWIERTVDPGLIDKPLLGNSCGGALALGLWSVWTGKSLDDGLITSFALAASGGSAPDGLCHPIMFEERKLNAVAYDARTSGRKKLFLIADGQQNAFGQVTGVEIKSATSLRAAVALAETKTKKRGEAKNKVRQAQELMRTGKQSEAIKEMSDALAIARASGDEEEEVEILVGLALISSERRGRGDRQYYFQEAEKKVGKLKSSAAKAIYYRARAASLEEKRDLVGAEQAYTAALNCCSETDDEKGNLATQGCIVRSSFVHFLCNQKRLEEARTLLDECEHYGRQHKDAEEGELLQAALEAGVHWSLEAGDEDGAIKRINELQQAASTSRLAFRIGGDLINVANQASRRNAHRAALTAAETSIRLGRRCDDGSSPGFLVGALYTEARVILEAGDDEKALAKAEAIIDLCHRSEDAIIKQAVHHLIAEVRRCSGDSQAAVDLARLALAEATGQPEEIAFAKSALARALNDNGQCEEALKQAREAWILARPSGIPARGAIDFLSQITNYGSQLGEDISEAMTEIGQLPDESDDIKADKEHAIARVSAIRRLRDRFLEVSKTTEPDKAAETSKCKSLPEANAAVVRPLLRLWEELPEKALGGAYDFWGRGNFARMLQNARRFPNSFNVTLEVRSLEDVKRAIRLWGLYADFLILLWKGETKSGLVIIPFPDDYDDPGGWGYTVCAGDVLKKEGSKKIWHPAMAHHSVFPDEVAAFLATEARAFIKSGRLVVVPAVSAGCISPGHGPFEQLLAEAANALPGVRWKGFEGTPIGYVPHSPNAPFDLLAELAETESDRLRKLRLLLLKRSRELKPDGEVGLEAKTLSLEIDDALRDLEDRNDAFARKKGLAKAKEPLAGATARFRSSGEKLSGATPDSPFAPLFILQSLGYGWRVDGPDVLKLPPRFEPQQGDVIGTWLAPPSGGWDFAVVRVPESTARDNT